MEIIGLEYCHVTPDTDWETEIRFANEHAPTILKAYSVDMLQKCIMIDDLHSKKPISNNFLDNIVNRLLVKPDCIYLESSFTLLASEIANKPIDPKVGELTNENERQWLRDVSDKYNSSNDFLVSWRKSDGTIMFSCPTFVAASYLYRLRFVNADIKPVFGEHIIKGTYPEALKKISWSFY